MRSFGSLSAGFQKTRKFWNRIRYWSAYTVWFFRTPTNSSAYYDPSSEVCALLRVGWERAMMEYYTRRPRPEEYGLR